MVNALTLKIKESVYHDNSKYDGGDNKGKINCIIENGSQIINVNDGLTLQEVYDALIVMLNGNLDLVRKVLSYTQEMVAHGMYITQESQLNKRDVYKMISNLKNQSTSINEIKLLPSGQEDSIKLKKSRKQSRGRG